MNIKNFIIILLLLFIIDSVYISMIYKSFANQIKLIQKSDLKINIIASILCYLFLSFAINYFLIDKINVSIYDAFFLGLSIYGVYELTSKGVLENWDWNIVILDTLWGGILFSIIYYISTYLKLSQK